MLIQKQTPKYEIISVDTLNQSLEQLLDKEFLLTNTRGGYCSSTVIGCNTRRYHGLLIGSLEPPANRILALSGLLEMIICNGQIYNLSTCQFNEKFHPAGYSYIKKFTRGIGAHFEYNIEGIELTKSVYLMRNEDTVLVEYDFSKVDPDLSGFEFTIRPFIALRDFHCLQKSYARFCSYDLDGSLFVCHDVPGSCELLMSCQDSSFEKDPQWWFNFTYRRDKERGQEFAEDLWTAGFYRCKIDPPDVSGSGTKVLFKASTGLKCDADHLGKASIDRAVDKLKKSYNTIIENADARDETKVRLVLAADQFICSPRRSASQPGRRKTNGGERTTILAGYPWFFDWGRDAFISLPGLLLATGRFDEAKSVLTTFAAAADEGMIPNRFDDRSNTAYFNSIDASLWFINAAFVYLQTTGDGTTFNERLLPVIEWIIDSYQNPDKSGRFGIRADSGGLISAGDIDTQLTWMDAKYDGIAFTPRHGKAVEVNALWYNALCLLARYYATSNIKKAKRFDDQAERVEQSFRHVFWNEDAGCLNDCVDADGTVDTSCRCNQILAVSLRFSPLTAEQQKRVVDVVKEKLLTPFGLRTLSAGDNRYKGTYTGDQYHRDSSYHQGTVWPYMIGPYIEALLKVNDFSVESKIKAAELLEPLLEHLTGQGCLGSISEIFDGEPPHKHRGCIAQAWSVAEIIRVLGLING
ncbi:MAG: glycogen debranching enzyme family protein [Sedimentisphaerales bacterium]|nr:glycogen debranching enzyme family protein [Sedimentisphaerales bacterium]